MRYIMLELGTIQKLDITKSTPQGMYLRAKNAKKDEEVLLPNNQVPKNAKVGDELEVFIYKDSEDRITATLKKPKITLGKMAYLKVVQLTKIGAFLDWGLEKDLFLPPKNQTVAVEKDKSYLVGLYLDDTGRLSATMDIFNMLTKKSPFNLHDKVTGMVYNVNEKYGTFVAVEGKYNGLIPVRELDEKLSYGDKIDAKIIKIKDDGRLDLSTRKDAFIQMGSDSDKILKLMKTKNGKLPLNDNSHPKDIYNHLKMSKAAFKRAVGRLMKERKIKITNEGIELI